MSMTGCRPMPKLSFGPFVLDTESRTLSRNGQRVTVTAKVLDTLIVLVANRGRVTSKDELLQALWPDTTVEEANLAQNISMIRRVLGDSSKEYRYIATIPGRGYRFAVPVTRIVADTSRAARHRCLISRRWRSCRSRT